MPVHVHVRMMTPSHQKRDNDTTTREGRGGEGTQASGCNWPQTWMWPTPARNSALLAQAGCFGGGRPGIIDTGWGLGGNTSACMNEEYFLPRLAFA